MGDEPEKPPKEKNPIAVAQIAAIMILVELLTELKQSGGVMSYERLEQRLQTINETGLGKSNPESTKFIGAILEEVRSRSA